MLKDYLSHNLVYKKNNDWSDGKYDFYRDWQWFIENSNLKNDAVILELGCGASPYLRNFTQFSKKYLGIDISQKAIDKAKARNQNNPDNEFLCQNFITDWKNERKFDLIIDSFFLHCIIDGDRKIAIKKIVNSLIADGELWVNTMCNPPKTHDLLKSYNPKTKCMEIESKFVKISVRQFESPETIRKLIEFYGLSLVKEKVLSDEIQDNYLAIFKK